MNRMGWFLGVVDGHDGGFHHFDSWYAIPSYHHGQHHGDKLVSGAACQVWLEAEDTWVEGTYDGHVTCID